MKNEIGEGNLYSSASLIQNVHYLQSISRLTIKMFSVNF